MYRGNLSIRFDAVNENVTQGALVKFALGNRKDSVVFKHRDPWMVTLLQLRGSKSKHLGLFKSSQPSLSIETIDVWLVALGLFAHPYLNIVESSVVG